MEQNFPLRVIVACGNLNWNFNFCYLKLFKLHAVLDDAAVTVSSRTGKGLGYWYKDDRKPNCCSVGHVTAQLFCRYVK